ncbi:DUF559 domain-containing protein [Mesorhizobium sp. SB112]|uniref:endonuclease domain-containing protein n=1 Tax=Mesorhizobium sp. SB112 TaxID=3151853 RepID=UPI003265BC98
MRGPKQATTNRARNLRNVENDAETILWSELRNRRLNGHKFVRQLPIGRYFADFACREARLVVEVDGSQHAENKRDRIRDQFMVSEGWSVLRVWNVDVLRERNSVLESILAAIDGRLDRNIEAYDLRFTSADDYEERTS